VTRQIVVRTGDRPEAGPRRGGVRKEERWAGFRSGLASEIMSFIVAKRAFGRKYATDERMLRLFDAYLAEQDVARPDDVTPAMVDAFLASRSTGPRYFNSLRAIVRRLMRWLVAQGRLKQCDLTGRRRPVLDPRMPFIFDPTLARRLLGMAAELADHGWARRRGATYRTLLFTLDGRRHIHSGSVSMTFLGLVRRMQLDVPDGMAAQRMHDLRHSFAVRHVASLVPPGHQRGRGIALSLHVHGERGPGVHGGVPHDHR